MLYGVHPFERVFTVWRNPVKGEAAGTNPTPPPPKVSCNDSRRSAVSMSPSTNESPMNAMRTGSPARSFSYRRPRVVESAPPKSSMGIMSESAGSMSAKSSTGSGSGSAIATVSRAASPPVGCSSNIPSHDTEVSAPVGEEVAAVRATVSATLSRSTWNSSTSISGIRAGLSAAASSSSKRTRSEKMLARRSDTPHTSMGGMKLIAMSAAKVAAATSTPRAEQSPLGLDI